MTTKVDSIDVQKVAETAKQHLDLAGACLSEEFRYQSLPLCVLDSVFSIGIHYSIVQNAVARYCDYFRTPKLREDRGAYPPRAEQQSIPDMLHAFEALGVETFAQEVVQCRNRTSPRGGILKSEAVWRFSKVLDEHGITHFQDMATLTDRSVEKSIAKAIAGIPGQGSGISWQYFLMLAGNDELIKPDRMVLRFLEGALGRPVTVDEALPLLRDTVDVLKQSHPHLTPAILDYTVWSYQRNI